MKPLWDKQRIIRTLRQLHSRGQDLSYNHLASRMQSLVSAACYHMGSYRKAVIAAGLDYAHIMRRPRWNRRAIVELIQQAKRRGDDLHWSAVTRRRDELGKAAFAALQPRTFGSWERALSAAGLDAKKISRYRHWDRKSILAELKSRRRARRPLNSGAIQHEDPGMHAAAVRHFGSYEKALRTAGFDPAKLRQRRQWTRPGVLRELELFARRHGALFDSDLRREAPALYGATIRLFRSVAIARRALHR